MLPAFLVPETTITENGSGAVVALEGADSALILVTLGITAVVEQELLEVAIWDSPDGHAWSKQPVAAFPQKFYAGNWAIVVDVSRHPEARFLQARWTTQ